jgi:hypothetical protein
MDNLEAGTFLLVLRKASAINSDDYPLNRCIQPAAYIRRAVPVPQIKTKLSAMKALYFL